MKRSIGSTINEYLSKMKWNSLEKRFKNLKDNKAGVFKSRKFTLNEKSTFLKHVD